MANAAEQKVALITGAGSGIGLTTAHYFASRGHKVVVADINAAHAAQAAAEIEKAGGAAVCLATDVSDEASAEALVRITLDTYGRLDYAVNNAGVEGRQSPAEALPKPEWDRVLAVNLTGVWLCMKYEIAHFRKQKQGAIVNVASIAGLVAFANSAAYTASKHGVIGLTKAAALECAPAGIRVNAICPGVIQTPMIERAAAENPKFIAAVSAAHPMQRIGKPEEVAELAYFLCTSARFVTGAAIPVDGGYTAQ